MHWKETDAMQERTRFRPPSSRYLLRCEAVLNPDGVASSASSIPSSRSSGLPAAIRYDKGPPFASTGAAGLTRLSVWWLQRCNLHSWARSSRPFCWGSPGSIRSRPLEKIVSTPVRAPGACENAEQVPAHHRSRRTPRNDLEVMNRAQPPPVAQVRKTVLDGDARAVSRGLRESIGAGVAFSAVPRHRPS